MIELLAPAGSMEALRAAVQNGANAVYLGCGSFNARQSAKNFTPETLGGDPAGDPFPLFAMGALYLFVPTQSGEGGEVRVLVSKDMLHFAKTPVAFAKGCHPLGVAAREEAGAYVASVQTEEGAVAFRSEDLFHWEA